MAGRFFGEEHEQIMPDVQKQSLPAQRGPAAPPLPLSGIPVLVLTDSDGSGTVPVQ